MLCGKPRWLLRYFLSPWIVSLAEVLGAGKANFIQTVYSSKNKMLPLLYWKQSSVMNHLLTCTYWLADQLADHPRKCCHIESSALVYASSDRAVSSGCCLAILGEWKSMLLSPCIAANHYGHFVYEPIG